MRISRRTALAGMGAAATAEILFTVGGFGADPDHKRFSATSTDGRKMLAIYAGAVAKMKKLDEEPQPSLTDLFFSWKFQWYIHMIPGTTDFSDPARPGKIDDFFGAQQSPAKELAKIVWSTCQAHSKGFPEGNFLPWHRAYLLCFEAIVRAVAKNDGFTLPYWDYTTDAVLPAEFRMPGDATFGPLYMAERWDEVNQGQPVEGLGLRNMQETIYMDPKVPGLGFNYKLDSELHGDVHVGVGTDKNMGRVPYAAGDPIFWLHHCNIDRIWAGWNAAGGKNPTTDTTWMKNPIYLVDASKQQKQFTNGGMIDIAALGYSYDDLPKVPPSNAQVQRAASTESQTVAQNSAPVRLSADRAEVELTVQNPERMSSIQTLGDSRHQFVLLISGLGMRQPATLKYNVYAKQKSGAGEQPGIFIGSINFFDAPVTDAIPEDGRTFAFRLLESAANSNADFRDIDALSYVLVPARPVPEGTAPVIGQVKLLEQTFSGGILQ